MKILIEYDKDKDKFYFNFDGFETETIYGFYAANEKLNELFHNSKNTAEILDQVQNSDFGLIIEV